MIFTSRSRYSSRMNLIFGIDLILHKFLDKSDHNFLVFKMHGLAIDFSYSTRWAESNELSLKFVACTSQKLTPYTITTS